MKVKVSTLYKYICAIFATYYTVIMMVFTSTRGLLLPLGALMLGMLLFIIAKTKPKYKDVFIVPISAWLAFTVIELVVAPFVSANVSYATSSLTTFLKLVIMCLCLEYTAFIDNNSDFLIKLMYFDSLLYVFFMITSENTIGGRLALVNANADANVCLIGIVTGSMMIGKSKKGFNILILASMIPMIYASLMTGSRKSLYCMLFYLGLWAFAEFRTTWKTLSFGKKMGIVCLAAIAVFFIIKIGIPFFYASNTYLRMTDSYVINSDQVRITLYQEAWDHFKKHPIFGIGFNQFRLYNARGLYSHSTYAEILACGGIVGVILFFIPHIWMLYWLIKILRFEKTYEERKETLLMLVYVLSSLFLAAGMVQTSNERVLMMYSVVFGYITAKSKCIKIGKMEMKQYAPT